MLRADATWIKSVTAIAGATATVTSGSPIITISGSPGLLALGLDGDINQPATVCLKNGNTIWKGTLLSVDSNTQITLRQNPNFSASGVSFLVNNFRHSINDTNSFLDLSGNANGTMWTTASASPGYFSGIFQTLEAYTCTAVNGSPVVTFQGGMDLYAKKLRVGDVVRVGTGANEQHSLILSIDSPTQLTMQNDATFSASGQDWMIASGEGYHEAPSSDNGINSFAGTGLWRANAACAFGFGGLYGPLLCNQQIDYAGGFSIRVGGGNLTPVLNPTFLHNYSEDSGSGFCFYIGSAQGVQIWAPTDQGEDVFDNCLLRDVGGVTGTYIGRGGMFGFTEAGNGNYLNNIPSNNLYNAQSYGLIQYGEAELTPDGATPGFSFPLSGNVGAQLAQMRNLFNPASTDRTVAATPSIAMIDNSLAWVGVKAGQQGKVILQDDTYLNGSKLRLHSNQVILQAGQGLLLLCDGDYWYEVGRYPGSTSCAGRAGELFNAGDLLALGNIAGLPYYVRADANGATPNLQNPVAVCMGVVPNTFDGVMISPLFAGEASIPDARWVGGVPAVTDVGSPVYLAETPGSWTLTAPATVVRCGTVSRGGAGLVRVVVRF